VRKNIDQLVINIIQAYILVAEVCLQIKLEAFYPENNTEKNKTKQNKKVHPDPNLNPIKN
jgi:hypothetical protein